VRARRDGGVSRGTANAAALVLCEVRFRPVMRVDLSIEHVAATLRLFR